MAEHLNSQYIIRAAKTKIDIKPTQGNPMDNYRKVIGNKSLNLSFHPVGRLQITDHMKKINPSKSSATDGISMKFINQIKETITPQIQHLVNNTIISSKCPSPLKI